MLDLEFLKLSRRNISNGLDDILVFLREELTALQNIAPSLDGEEYLMIDATDEFTPLDPENGVYTLKFPTEIFSLKQLKFFLNEPAVGADFIIDAKTYDNEIDSTVSTILTAPLSIAAGELSSQLVTFDEPPTIRKNSLRIDILQTGITSQGAGLKIFVKLLKNE